MALAGCLKGNVVIHLLRIFSFDEQAAFLYGEISSKRERKGLAVDPVDLMIGSIAKYHRASIATRNTKDFESCGINPINPWRKEE